MKAQKSDGNCLLCGTGLEKGAVSRHLKLCAKTNAATGKAAEKPKIKAFHVFVEGLHLPEYWLHLSVPAGAKLEALDDFLKEIWLECCGHLSAFKIEKTLYSVHPSPEWDEKGMRVEIGNVLAAKMKFTYDYDFGSTTSLALKGASEIENESASIRLLARNNPPVIPCAKCGKPATKVCVDCAWDEKGWLCAACAPKHKCGEDMLLPVVNSPRVGVCCYGEK